MHVMPQKILTKNPEGLLQKNGTDKLSTLKPVSDTFKRIGK